MFLTIQNVKICKKRVASACVLALLIMLLAACAGSIGNMGHVGGVPVQISENDFRITSSIKTFAPSMKYHFIIRNNGHTTHEFMIMPLAMSRMDGMSMNDMDQMSLADVEGIAPGQAKTLDFTIPASAAGAQLQFACHYPGHYEAGMSLNVAVNA